MSICRRISREEEGKVPEEQQFLKMENGELQGRTPAKIRAKPKVDLRSLSELPQCNLEIGRSYTHSSTSLRSTSASPPVSFRYSHHVGQARKYQGRTQDEEVWQERAFNTSPHAKGQEVLPCGGRDKAKEGTFNAIMKIINPQVPLSIQRSREPEKDSMPGHNDSKASLQN